METTWVSLAELKRGVVGLDIETSGLSRTRDRVLVITLSDGERCYYTRQWTPELATFLSECEAVAVHNGTNFDIPMLLRSGASIDEVLSVRWVDTLTEAALRFRLSRYDLKTVLREALGVNIDKNIDHSAWSGELSDAQLSYIANDVRYLPRLVGPPTPRARLERALVPRLAIMANNGFPVDVDRLLSSCREWVVEAERCRAEFTAKYGVNPQSPKAVLSLLNALGIPAQSTGAADLAAFTEYEIVRDLLSARAARKLAMYNDEWVTRHVEGGRVFPSWWTAGTATGRMSCSDPNAQQFPPQVRACIGGSGVLSVDYSQIEIRVAAHVSRDPALLSAVASGDIHTAIAAKLFRVEAPSKEQRKSAKAVTFALLYGGSPNTIRRHAAAMGAQVDDPQDLFVRFFDEFYHLSLWRRRAFDLSRFDSVTVPLPFGERELVGKEVTPQRILNTIVQGTAAAGIKLAITHLPRRALVRCFGQVHDELVFEGDPDIAQDVEEAMLKGMEEVIPGTPISVEAKHAPYWS